MKLFKYGLPLAALAVLASCSNDKLEGPVGGPVQTPSVGNSNIAFQFKLANNGGTRAEYSYEDGDEAEYAVFNGQVYIFKGSNATNAKVSDATCIETAELIVPNDFNKDSWDYITTTGSIKAKLEDADGYKSDVQNYNYYVAVVLNVNPANLPDFETQVEGNTLEQFNEVLTNALEDLTYKPSGQSTSYFTMSSAPSYDGANAIYLAQLSNDWINNPTDEVFAATIFVQRLAAKVTLGVAPSSLSTEKGDAIAINGWALDNTNTSSYIFQKVADVVSGNTLMSWQLNENSVTTPDRFYAYNPNGINAHNRFFWSIDMNYDEKAEGLASAEEYTGAVTEGTGQNLTYHPQYCHENTFDVENMIKYNTTRVLIEATVTPHGNLLQQGEKAFLRNVNNEVVYTLETFKSAVLTTLYATENQANKTIIVNNPPEDAGYYSLQDLELQVKDGENEPVDLTAEQLYILVTKLNLPYDKEAVDNGDLTKPLAYYPEGVCYYQVRIRHFNDNELGLDSDWVMTSTGYNGEAAGQWNNQQFLGRYGVVRNNWYDLSVQSVSKIGTPTPPELDPDDDTDWDDDPKDHNIMVNIAILSWAKRNQNVDL